MFFIFLKVNFVIFVYNLCAGKQVQFYSIYIGALIRQAKSNG